MRESIGGTWLFGIVITFIALFSGFLSYAVSYTKAFNMKNEILNLIERNEGWTRSEDSDDLKNKSNEALSADPSVEAQAYLLIKNSGYNHNAAEDIDCATVNGYDSNDEIQIGGYCVKRYCQGFVEGAPGVTDEEGNQLSFTTYYKVTTFIAVRIPVVNVVAKIPITGETRTLVYDYGADSINDNCR